MIECFIKPVYEPQFVIADVPESVNTTINETTMKIRDRIKELRRVPAKELIPNPKNWRTHPDRQRNVLKGILAEVG